MHSGLLLVFVLTSVLQLCLSSQACPPTPQCDFGCSLINVNGCNQCQCPSYHPCVFFNSLLPFKCLQCIQIYQENGCVSSCKCTQTLADVFSGFGKLYSRDPRGLLSFPELPNPFNWTQIDGASKCGSIFNCDVSKGCHLEWRWFQCPLCNCPGATTAKYMN